MATGSGVVAVTKVVDNGPDEDRWVLVISGDGYTHDQMGDFENHVEDFLDYLQDQRPFDGTLAWGQVNVYRIDVESTETGASNVACNNVTVDTYFGASFCHEDENGSQTPRLLTINNETAFALADAHAPEWDAILIFVNVSTEPGGSGDEVAVTSLAAFGVNPFDTALHELGHCAFGLADEYPYFADDDPAFVEPDHQEYTGDEPIHPNTTINTDRATLKWADYVDPATSIPTVENPDATCATWDDGPSPEPVGTVGLFEGAGYYRCGIYRPEHDCRMRNQEVQFCAVCEGVVFNRLWFWEQVDLTPCFVATAVYGDPAHPDVDVIRRFRDRRLLRGSRTMRALAAVYQRVGPSLARFTRPRVHTARCLRRVLFEPLAMRLRRRERKELA